MPIDTEPPSSRGGPARVVRTDTGAASLAVAASDEALRCGVCLEEIGPESAVCPACGEDPAPSFGPLSARPDSLPVDTQPSWLHMHWRPVLTMGVLGSLMASGVALRYLAPDALAPEAPAAARPMLASPVCDTPCWNGEACQAGVCVWQTSNEVGHVSSPPLITGPFALHKDVMDVLPLDADRFLAATLVGIAVHDARTGEVLSTVTDAPLAQQLHRVGDMVYATAPQRIYVVDVATMQLRKTIEVGGTVESLTAGASGRRVLASIPGAGSVAVISTDYHAEINRFFFGNDAVGPVAMDDTGQRALTTNGHAPWHGVRPSRGAHQEFGAMYAFDPSALPSSQDRVRTAMVGNPADVLMAPDDRTSYVVLREKNAVVPVTHLPHGVVRQGEYIPTCHKPEQIELVPRGRRALVRCDAGRALDVIDLRGHRSLRRIPMNSQATDVVVSPDARQAIITFPSEGRGAVGLLDLDTYELTMSPLGPEPHGVRLAPDGKTATIISHTAKAAWSIR